MIKITRCKEPDQLAAVRPLKLAQLRLLGREPTSDDIDGYKVVAQDLWSSQHFKCCYCETKIQIGFNDVEHYRPKGKANRNPGSSLVHGYWWLAFTWANLLFACPGCNRSGKNSLFPLALKSKPLLAELDPPGEEEPLLLDPGSAVNPVEHIEFVYSTAGGTGTPAYWWARPRDDSVYGNMTIDVCKLNRSELLELRNDYVSNFLEPQVNALNAALLAGKKKRIRKEYDRAREMMAYRNSYVCLTFDVFRFLVSDAKLRALNINGWPKPGEVT